VSRFWNGTSYRSGKSFAEADFEGISGSYIHVYVLLDLNMLLGLTIERVAQLGNCPRLTCTSFGQNLLGDIGQCCAIFIDRTTYRALPHLRLGAVAIALRSSTCHVRSTLSYWIRWP